MIRHPFALLALAFTLAGCVPAPSSSDTPIGSAAIPGGTSLAFGCAHGELIANATLIEGDEDSWAVVFATESGDELERVELPDAGAVTAAASTATADACTPCTATLLAVTAGTDTPLLTVRTHTDADGDGYAAGACGGSDCIDTDDAVNPDADEVCDGVDNDCSGLPDDLPDAPLADDQDGVCAGARKVCDGNGGWIEPDYTALATYEATEVTCDGLDNDCSGQADDLAGAPDADDQDGVCLGAKKVCDGGGGWVEPDYADLADYEATEAACDGLDNDCDGTEDNFATIPPADEQDGVCLGSVKVCNGSGWEEPDYTQITDYEATEAACDGLDNDCDGDADVFLDAPLADLQAGVCTGARKSCDGSDWQEPDYTAIATYEVDEATCDDLDNDCNDIKDDLPADAGDLSSEQDGVCLGSRLVCDTGEWVEPDLTLIAGYEAVETLCDGDDNDCDGTEDNFATIPEADKTDGVCVGSVKECYGSGWVEPDYTLIATYEPIEEACDNLDNDCDGREDVTPKIDPNNSTLECWGAYTRHTPELVDAGPWQTVALHGVRNDTTDFACGITADQRLMCWGRGSWYAGIGDGTYTDRRTPAEVSGGGTWSSLALGGDAACAIDTDDLLWCWGSDWSTGNSSPDESVPIQVDSATWKQVSLGSNHRCGLHTDGSLRCWGTNDYGLLPTAVNYRNDTPLDLGADFTGAWDQVRAGERSSCGLRPDGSLLCWGANDYLQLGVDATTVAVNTAVPVPVAHPDGKLWDQVSAGARHTCALDVDGGLYCWGRNAEGQLGLGTTTASESGPQLVAGTWIDVTAAFYSTCAVDASHVPHCWGQVRTGAANPYPNPDPTALTGPATSQASPSGLGSVCFVDDTDAGLWCAGAYYHQDTGPFDNPRAVAAVARGAATHAGDATMWIDANGDVIGIGTNNGFRLGLGATVEGVDAPTTIVSGDFVQLITASNGAAMAITATGQRYAWGQNPDRILGYGSQLALATPYAVADGITWAQLDVGFDNACGVATTGELYTWGNGVGTPTLVGTGWDAVACSTHHHCAIDTVGGLACWGRDTLGQVGNGDATNTDVAYADRHVIAGTWAKVAAYGNNTCAVRDDDTLWCWGRGGDNGVLGDGGTANATEPVQIAGTWTDVVMPPGHACALSGSGEAWCWGSNDVSQLDLELTTESSTVPVRIDPGPYTDLWGSRAQTCALKPEFIDDTCP